MAPQPRAAHGPPAPPGDEGSSDGEWSSGQEYAAKPAAAKRAYTYTKRKRGAPKVSKNAAKALADADIAAAAGAKCCSRHCLRRWQASDVEHVRQRIWLHVASYQARRELLHRDWRSLGLRKDMSFASLLIPIRRRQTVEHVCASAYVRILRLDNDTLRDWCGARAASSRPKF